MTFNESNTVEAFGRDQLCGAVTHHTTIGPGLARRNRQVGGLGRQLPQGMQLPRQPHEVLAEDHQRDALISLHPSIAAQPDRVHDVLDRLRAVVMTVRDSGLVKAGENFADLSLDVSNGGVLA